MKGVQEGFDCAPSCDAETGTGLAPPVLDSHDTGQDA